MAVYTVDMRKLIKGIVQFRQKALPSYREKFADLALGQKPDALFIACSDSRVAPNVFASTDPGDLFVIRNVGNFIPEQESASAPSVAAAVEFAVFSLKVRNIVVCGHSECGATRALLEPPDFPAPALDTWLRNSRAAVERYHAGLAPDTTLAPHNQVSQINTLLQLEHLLTYPFVRDAVEAGHIGLHAWWFDIKYADVYAWERELGRYVLIDEKQAESLIMRLPQ